MLNRGAQLYLGVFVINIQSKGHVLTPVDIHLVSKVSSVHKDVIVHVKETLGFIWYTLFCPFIFLGSEIQEGEVYLPVISNKYILDLSRTRSYFLPGYPIDVVVCQRQTKKYNSMYLTPMTFNKRLPLFLLQVVMRLPDGSPAANVQINIDIEGSTQTSHQAVTDQDGAVFHVFNINSGNEITVQVSILQLIERFY